MEYVPGESLEQVMQRQRLSLDIAIDYAGQVLEALECAHRNGVIHRDVSPANIIITPEGCAKLTDFGLAREAGDVRLSNAGVAMGSPWYMSPEQVRAADELDARSDIYAMGAVLHEMLTGRRLFDVQGSFAIMRAQIEAVPEPPSAHNPNVPEALDKTVAKALAKDAAARFQSAAEFRGAMMAAIGTGVQAARASAPVPRVSVGGPFRLSGAASTGVLGSAALAAVVCTALFWPKPAYRTSQGTALPEYVPPKAAAMETAPPSERQPEKPDETFALPAIDAPVKARSSHVPSQPPARPRRPTIPSPQSASIAHEEHAVLPPAPVPASKPASAEPLETGGTSSVEQELPAPAAAAIPTMPAPEIPALISDEAKHQKPGNGFVKALGKIESLSAARQKGCARSSKVRRGQVAGAGVRGWGP